MKTVKMSLRRMGVMCLFLIVNFSLCHAQKQKQEKQDEDYYDKKWRRSFLTNQIVSTNEYIYTTTFEYYMKLPNQAPKTVSNFSVVENKLRDNVLATKEEE